MTAALIAYTPPSPFKFRIRAGSHDEQSIFDVVTRNRYLRGELRIAPGSVVLDVGGHVGSFTVLAGYMGAGRIITYEPCSESFELLAFNVELNGVPQAVLRQQGILPMAGRQELTVVSPNYGGSSFHRAGPVNETVECVTLQQVFDEHNVERCDLLKVGCEQTVLEILEGFPYLDRVRQITAVLVGVEYAARLRDFLQLAGFRVAQEGAVIDNQLGYFWAWRDAA